MMKAPAIIKSRRHQNKALPLASLLVAAFLFFYSPSFCQNKADTIPNGTDGLMLTVPPPDSALKYLQPNEFNGPLSTFKIGLGFIYDWTAYSKDETFKQQMDSGKLDVYNRGKLRDFRVLGSGALKTKRPISWKFAYMWDGDADAWLVRETGVTVGVPELGGNIFVGRTKVGFSLVKVMNGHSPWGYERQMAIDAIPILADGIKWFGSLPKSRIFWNLGYYNDVLSKGQGFSTFAWQGVARVGWLPFNDTKNNKLLHIAGEIEYGAPVDGKFTMKSRPESNNTPQLINTGAFAADKATQVGFEIYYRNKRFMIGSEIVSHGFTAEKSDHHRFNGGDFVISYLFTKTVRPYNTGASIFGFVPVKKSIFKGGLGELEGVVHVSTMDLNDGAIQGGKMTRITPMVNWYMSKVIRMEFIYGYGILERFNKTGIVQFFESRIQFTVM
jgi:phosphate-selective porin OprO/OprP